MPLYEYQCEACEQITERIQKFSDPLLETCPSCGGKMKKLLSSPAIQFKGSGWYITDYAKKGGGKSEKSEKSESSEKSGKSESSEKSESKTDKTESKTETKTPSTN